MLSQDFRRKFLQFFKKKGHTIVPSSPVVPHDDPTLLFNNAGMNQFKDVFLGNSKRDYTKAVSAQKCIRVGGKHNDLDNVGHTSRHLTFFEMLGNFSFGDYFKKEAIAFAWELTTEGFQFEVEKLWATVFEEDDEAFELWKAYLPEERIVRMGAKENFWAMGDTGPCGPCSELHYDRGEAFGSARSILEDKEGERYLEFWNLVFMEFNRDLNGRKQPLPNKSIDTGAGIERVVGLKMGVDNVFHTDILRHIIGRIEQVAKVGYDEKRAAAFHVIADHVRSLAFAIADGAQPSNIERGYILRKLLRRAVRYGRTQLGLKDPFLAEVFPAVVETMGADYREIESAKKRIAEILTLEEEGFIRTLKRGGGILSTVVDKAKEGAKKQISGEDAFKLKDTYGFPLEEILLIAKDSGLEVNIDAYQILEEKARELSRKSRSVKGQEASESLFANFVKTHGECQFTGYGETHTETEILAIVQDGEFVETLSPGSDGQLILKATPFYAEKGGQVADTGLITSNGARFHVTDCQSPFPGVIVHEGTLEGSPLAQGAKVLAKIDEKKRERIAAHHTATHLLHWALQKVLGGHIRQAGSLVEEHRLRFDFNHHKALSAKQVREIEDLVNEKVRENQSVTTYEITLEEAQNTPDIKQFFGEKYGSHVRVVDISYSKELCGGTHAYHVGMLGYFRITKESSIASGVRRIEAVCGVDAEQFAREKELQIERTAALLKVQPAKLEEKISHLLDEMSEIKAETQSLKKAQMTSLADELAKKAKEIHGMNVVAEVVDIEPKDLADLADLTLMCCKSGVVILASKLTSRVQLQVKVSSDLTAKGVSALNLIKTAGPFIGGGGGGKPEAAQAGGKNPEGTTRALETMKQALS